MVITVFGEHTLDLAPERAIVRLGAQHESSDKAAALAAVDSALRAVVDELDELAGRRPSPVARRVVEPARTNSWAETLPDGTRVLHHNAYAQVQVEFTDFEALSESVAGWGVLEGIQVEGVEWQLTDETRAARQDEVVTAAVRDARQRAAVLARAAGLGEPVLVELADPGLLTSGGGSGLEQGGMMQARAFKASADGVSPEPADITVSARVHARFEA